VGQDQDGMARLKITLITSIHKVINNKGMIKSLSHANKVKDDYGSRFH
jgi:hypothetical protein